MLSSHFDIVRRIINTITVCDVDMVCIQIYVKAVDARPATLDVGDATVFVRDDTPSMLSLKFVRTATWTTRFASAMFDRPTVLLQLSRSQPSCFVKRKFI